jgi:hypothetical protein
MEIGGWVGQTYPITYSILKSMTAFVMLDRDILLYLLIGIQKCKSILKL